MLEIDGGEKSGSGTILRLSIALASILNEELHIFNIRKKRDNPGLRPQHLEAVLTAAKLVNAEVKGAYLGSKEIWFKPGTIKGGNFESEIGTAGSIPMLFMTVLPICIFAKEKVNLTVKKGGTDVRAAPTINYLKNVLLKVLNKMGINANIQVIKYGYYPVGMGEAVLSVEPVNKLFPLILEEFGNIKEICGISICTFLKDRKVSERQASAASRELKKRGFDSRIDIIYDESNPMQKGSSIVLWCETDKGTILGSDAIGEIGKSSENVGMEAAEKLILEIERKVTVDVHLADMLIPYMALANKESAFIVREVSDHLETNIWLCEKILGTEFLVSKVNGNWMIRRV
ncbi:MAG: RNA 3'-terminal phosphate cyclase [Nitrososphaeria archaeon]|nr:RNA 3'-terminal phosphate cyclase [Nitrososphaeria archaeon]